MVEKIKKDTSKQGPTESQSAEQSLQLIETVKTDRYRPRQCYTTTAFVACNRSRMAHDYSLMSCTEMEIMITYCKTRRYLSRQVSADPRRSKKFRTRNVVRRLMNR